ncbi:MAG: diguanylate cyclase, partial [Trueperaceae bacterium]|nr:diguanylate cyclase [Trueperaceae bacterium]
MYPLALAAASAVYVLAGFYVLANHPRRTLGVPFVAMAASVAVWAFALSHGGIAADADAAVFWRRVGAVGWTTLFAFLLHFVLALTGQRRFLAHRLAFPVLYFPAAVSLYVFVLRGDLAARYSDVVAVGSGWTAVAANSAANWAFFAYYAATVGLAVALIGRWGARSADREVRAQARMLTWAFLAALVLGSLTDRLANAFIGIALPQAAPLVILAPIAVFAVAVLRFGRMVEPERRKVADEGRILSDEKRPRFYRHLALAYVVGGLLNGLHDHFFEIALGPVVAFSAALYLIAAVLLITPRLPGGDARHDNVLLLVVSLSIPLILFRFADAYASNIVWPVPLILMGISAIFERRRMLFVLAGTTVLTQIALWVRVPALTVDVGAVDHAARLTFYGIGFVLAYYMNGVYMRRLAANEEQVVLQRTVSRVSAEFVTVSAANLPDKLSSLVAATGAACRADRAYLFTFDHEHGTMVATDEWCAPGVDPGLPEGTEFALDEFPWWMRQLEGGGVVHVADVAALPPEAAAEREVLERQHIHALLSVPVWHRGNLYGFLGLDDVGSGPLWHEAHTDVLRVLANLTSDALGKVEAEVEIQRLAYADPVTGLANRTLLRDRLEQALPLAARSGSLVGVMLIDLDAFKEVNDTVGHGAGDELLRLLAERLAGRVRRYDTVARFGGDEFVVVVPQVARPEDVQAVAGHVMSAFGEPFVIQGQEFFVTASAGVAVYPVDGEDADTLIKNADLAMYAAKARGKHRHVFCSPELKYDVQQRMRLINALYRAQERDELVLHYQPQVSVADGRVVGVEALLRWRHPELGVVSPGVFIPLAEQTGLIHAIGEWVLGEACRQSAEWRRRGLPPMRMAVNLSVQQFRASGLVGVVERALRDTGMCPAGLELEITESMAVD